jgi:hypothetical protein
MLPGALLFLLPVVVVDVSGDRLDATHTRELVGRELSVDAVAPDDPRAAQARGRIEVRTNPTDKKLTVKYRKLDEPVERTIDLPDEPSRAESDVALLAGNLARDEAGELTPAPAKPPAAVQPAKPSIAETLWSSEDDRTLAQMRAFLTQSAKDERAAQIRTGVVEMAVAGALIAPAIVIWASGTQEEEARIFGNAASMVGASLFVNGIFQLLIDPNELGPVAKKLREHEATGKSAKEAVELVEIEWADQAAKARTTRHFMGAFSAAFGALFFATGTLMTMGADTGEEKKPAGLGVGIVGLGGVLVVGAASLFAGESVTERSYRMWRTVRTTPNAGSNVSWGATVLPGGGGAASFALTF